MPPTHTSGAVAFRTYDYFYLGGLLAAHVQSRAFAVATSDFIGPHSRLEGAGRGQVLDNFAGAAGRVSGQGEEDGPWGCCVAQLL